MLMKKRVMPGSVTVTGPPRSICREKVGTTLPWLPSTLPKRTEEKTGLPTGGACAATPTTSSPSRLLAPSIFRGQTALSVEIDTKRSVPWLLAASTSVCVATTLVVNASEGHSSSMGTCL